MSDLISRADAVKAICGVCLEEHCKTECIVPCTFMEALEAVPPAEAEPIVIRSKTLLPTKDFKEWAKRIREENPNAVVIPCDAEVVSAYAEPKWNCTAQGEWIDIDNYYRMATCSLCRKVTMFEKWGEYTKPYDFCPNCGARMTPYKGGGEK